MTGWTLAVTFVSCGGLPHAPSGDPATAWLASTGFPERAAWPSAILHLSRAEMPDQPRISDLLGGTAELDVLPPAGKGWGVHVATSSQELGCELSVLLNGNDLERSTRFGAGRRLVLDDALDLMYAAFRASDLDGIEVHLGVEGPTRDESECGVVLLWVGAAADPLDPPFVGRIVATVSGEAADTVTSVVLDPTGERRTPEARGGIEFDALLPGLYYLTVFSRDEVLYNRSVRVYAFGETGVLLEVSR